ncbi:MAG: hypothetical protein QNJ37_24195 [Crocosphaera sp.]|nr:hypothetical protein [Crocosphaera sp.]
MSLFPILEVDDVFASLARKAEGDLRDETTLKESLFSKQVDKNRITLRLREILPPIFNLEYIENVVFPALVTTAYNGDRLSVPMIDPFFFNKEEALPYFLWGMLYDNWEPNLEEDGLSVFIQGYANRGEENNRKKIYYSALTPDLYNPMYQNKITSFFDGLFKPENANKPIMAEYYGSYFDLYWDLHLGVTGNDIPQEVRELGQSFNTVLAYLNPIEDIVHDNYIRVRAFRQTLKDWVDEKIEDLLSENTPEPEKTLAYYWLINGEQGDDFRRKDVVFECFHNFVALSQWGNTIYQIMFKLSDQTDAPEIKEMFQQVMSQQFDVVSQGSFTPLEQFVMELFRVLSPNAGSISTLTETGQLEPLYPRYGYVINPHKPTSEDPRHWLNPTEFDPQRYVNAPTSDQIDEARAKEIGFAQCPFHKSPIGVKDGRNTEITNSAFGTVYGSTDGQVYPVCDYAGYAPFGFGYRRCPGEQFTVKFVEDFLRKVWNDGIEFKLLDIPNPEPVPVGPGTVVNDNIGFIRSN